jgi:hypothetical protein
MWTTDLVFRGASAAYANKGYALSGNATVETSP